MVGVFLKRAPHAYFQLFDCEGELLAKNPIENEVSHAARDIHWAQTNMSVILAGLCPVALIHRKVFMLKSH